jgi:hypothetical protein
MNNKERLINIFNLLRLISVKGDDVMYLGQAESQLMQIIESMPNEIPKVEEEIKE